jgi:hypothetical protein
MANVEEERPATTSPERSPLAETTDPSATRVGRGSSIEAALIVTLLAGVWLIASPLALDYDEPSIAVIWGIVVVVLAALRLFGAMASKTLSLVTAAAGILIVVTAFVIGDSPGPTANMALMGLAVVIFALVGSAAPARSR